jgi:hypothetical protein
MASASKQQSSQKSEPSEPIFSSPLGPAFNNLFGIPMRYDPKRGGFEVGGQPGTNLSDPNNFEWRGRKEASQEWDQGTGRDFAPQIFGPETFGVLADQLAPTGGAGMTGYAAQAQQGLDQMINLFDQSILPGLEELVGTGFRTDATPIAEQMLRQFQQETIPGLAEQYSFLGGGGSTLSSDFGAAASRAGGDIFSNIGGLQTQLDEAASGRRMEGMELASILGSERVAAPLEAAGAIRAEELAARPGGQLLSFLEQLMGIEREPVLQGNYAQGSSSGSSWTAI